MRRPPSIPHTSFYSHIFRVSLLLLLLSGCIQDTWESLRVEKQDRPVTLEWTVDSPPLQNVEFISQSVGWSTGHWGTVWRTIDGGTTWELKFQDKNVTTGAVQFLNDGRNGWFIARKKPGADPSKPDGVVLTTTNGGDTWEEFYQASGYSIHSLHRSSTTSGCIAGDEAILCTNNGGQNWAEKIPQPGSFWSGLYFLSDGQHGWAWATKLEKRLSANAESSNWERRGTSIVRTSDGGQTWKAVGREIDYNVVALTFLADGQKGWALVTDLDERIPQDSESLKSRILYTEDGGVGWQQLVEGLSGGLKDFQFAADGRYGWAVGSTKLDSGGWAFGLTGSLILYTSDGGKTWVAQDPRTDDDELIDLDFLPGTTEGWAVGRKGSLVHTRDGTGWAALSKPSVDNFQAIRFTADGQSGWALGANGTILHTKDAGRHWERQYSQTDSQTDSQIGVTFKDLQIDLQGQRGWALGSRGSCTNDEIQILSTENGGKEWKTNCVKTEHPVSQAYLASDGRGWAFGGASEEAFRSNRKYLMFTADYGQSWETKYTFEHGNFKVVGYFAPRGPEAWIITNEAALLHTTDNGQTWNDVKLPSLQNTGYSINALTFMADGQKGWAVGDANAGPGFKGKCLILHTSDGGRTWNRQDDGKLDGNLYSINFLADGLRGWATGSEGNIFYTSDGGEHWQLQTNVIDSELKAAYFFDDQQGVQGWVVGQDGAILRTTGSKLHPVVDQYQVTSSTTGVELKWRLADDEADPFSWKPEDLKWQIDYCSQKTCSANGWQPILALSNLQPERSGGSEIFSYSWNPADKGIGPGTQIHYRIGVYDGSQWLAPQELGAHTYQPLWSRLTSWQRAGLIVAAVILVYLCVCFIMLWSYPWALFWMNEHLSVGDLIVPWAPPELKMLVSSTLGFVPWFAKHSRVNEAWIKRYLTQDNLRFADLSPSLQRHYVKQDASLDAWVAKHLTAAEELFLGLRTVAQRKIHIFMPIRIETENNSTLIDQPEPKDFQASMQAPKLVLTVVGIGGAGKSSLACQLARWAMSPLEEQRLAAHRMIPILIEEDTTDLLNCIKKQLTLIAADDLPDELLQNLLAKKRLLVLVDALSEKSKAMQDHLSKIYTTCPAHALVVTTRRRIDVLGASQVSLRPEEITVDRLAYFLLQYLKYSEAEDLFPRRKALDLADRLLSIAEASGKDLPLTPLLIVLFVNEAIVLAKKGGDMALLPVSIPETMIKYIKRLNDNRALPETKLIDSTLVLAHHSLGDNYVPHEFNRRKAVTALTSDKLWSESYDLLKELTECGILEERESAGTVFYRFKFDPVAEYLAALERIHTLSDDGKAWEQWVQTLKKTEGYPKRMDGFLAALRVCVSTYKEQFNLPALQLWEQADDREPPIPPAILDAGLSHEAGG
jgi:photosystem II stability/assembly factor-like uncharacterized protein